MSENLERPSRGVEGSRDAMVSLESLATTVESLATQHGLEYVRQTQSPHGEQEIWVKMRLKGPKETRDMNVRLKTLPNQAPGTIYVDGNILGGPNRTTFGEASLPVDDLQNYVGDKLDKLKAEPKE